MASKIVISSNQCFACQRCGQCCRRWHVALTERDLATLRKLDWRSEPDIPADPVISIHGHPYLAHRPNGDCVFLEPGSELCRLQRRFGVTAKPVGCRVYPLNIASTCVGGVSVAARFDCPATQRNVGPPLAHNRREIEEYVNLLGVSGGSSESEVLNPAAVESLARALREEIVLPAGVPPGRRSLGLWTAAQRLEKLGLGFLNDAETLRQVLPSVLQGALKRAGKAPSGSLSVFSRAMFREWLASYLRRDEEMIRERALARLRRTATLFLIFAGRSSFGDLGTEHPAVPLRQVHLFPRGALRQDVANALEDSGTEVWECYWRMVAGRLETLQFCGVCYYGQSFFVGLRALILTYPLVLAAARCHAAARQAGAIAAEDVRYATGAIDHSWGRSRLLQMSIWRHSEEFFYGPRYARLLSALGEGWPRRGP